MYDKNVKTTGDHISGEVKLGAIICLLARCDALYLDITFNITSKLCHNMLYEVLFHLVINTGIGCININKYINDEHVMACVSTVFSKRSYSILQGDIGVIGGCVPHNWTFI